MGSWGSLFRRSALALGSLIAAGAPLAVSQQPASMVENLREETRENISKKLKVDHVIDKNGLRESTVPNFRMWSFLPEDDATAVCRRLEDVRLETRKKWLGLGAEQWERHCEVHYYPDANQYAEKTGQPAHVPGHSSIELVDHSGHVVRRRISMHGKVGTLLKTVIPHETTHAVLAGQFAPFPPPRWFDEGTAVLAEHEGTMCDFAKTLPGLRDKGTLFTTKELLGLGEKYPPGNRIGAFYAQGATLVEFLASQKQGPRGVTEYVRDCLKGDREAATKKHYGMTLDQLHAAWEKHAFASRQPMKMK